MSDEKRKTKRNMDVTSASKSVTLSKMAGLVACVYLVFFTSAVICVRTEIDGDQVVRLSGSQDAVHHQRFARAAKFTIEELINTEFPLKDSNDLDLDPCKAGTFMGDIAIPDASRDRSISEEERQSIKALQQEVETLKKEVLLEGLQVEEEGLTDIIRKRTKLPPADTQKGDNFNDPLFGMEVNKDRKIDASIADKSKQELNFRHGGSNDVNLVTENVDTKKAETATPTVVTENSSTSSTPFLATTTDKSKNVEVIEQDGILIVNISSSNILTRDTILELTKTKEKTHITDQDLEEKKGKIQSNSKEITGDANGNFHKAKETTTSKADIESTTVSRRQNTLRSSGEVERSSSPKQVSSAETKNKHRRRRHNKRKRLINSSSSSINLSEQTPNSYYSGSNSEEEFSKRRRHNIRHGSHASPYYSRILKLKDELNTEDYIEGTKRSLSNYNGSIAIEKKTKNEFRDDLEQGILEPNFKKLDATEEYEITNQPNESVTEKIYLKQNDYEPKMKKFEYPIHEFEQKFEYKPKPKNLTTETLNETFVTENLAEVLLNFSGVEMFQSETMAGLLSNHSMDGQLSWNLTQDPTLLQDLDHTHDEEDNHEEHDHRRVSRAATGRKERIWEHGVIPYEIDGNFSGAHKALFKQAMRHWENFTCVKFVERQPADHVNYIVFTERQCGCCSFVGKRGNGAQAISIGKNCDKFGIVVHELGHVVGFWHEHTRPDRDNHVQIIRDNIMTGQEYNFNKLTDEEVNSLGQGYDYDSIMHYARNTFSKGTYLDTILPLEVRGKKRPEIGQRVRLSESDIAQTNLLYKCHKCGRTLQENSGSFSSPSYHSGSPSPEGERCEWRITATHGERIVLNITDLDIFKSNNCQSDYLEVRDGYWQRSVVLGRFCGAGRAVPAVLSSGPRLLLHYVSSAREVPSRGFMAHYEAVCGGELDLEAGGHLESPNYPDDYQPNKECVWKLTVPYEFQVALKFQSFEVENHDNCVYDYVEVRDGHSADSPLVGIFCGYKIPPDIRSTSNKLLVKFVSDGSVQKAGFSASFMQEYDECSLLLHGCQHDCINTLGGYECSCNIGYELHSDGKSCVDACGGVFDAPNGTITSPSFPELYPADKSCMWEIIAPPQHRITLNFTHFDIEGNNIHQEECEYDSLTVHSKLGADVLRRQGVYCGTRLPPSLVSEGNALRLIFTSDKSVQKSGFSAIYYTDNDECATNNGGCQHECRNTAGSYVCSCHNGFMLDENKHDCKEGGCKHEVTQPQGTINSPNYPDNYLPRKDCVWHFTTTPGHRIKLMFDVFEMEPHQECAYDHVVVYDGNSPDSPKLGRFCGSKSPHIIIANSNEMYMVFKSDASVQRKGFLATHNTVCGGRLMATSHVKHLYSHARFGDDQKYDIHTECEWTIEAPPGYSVQLTFLNFHLEEESSCGFDYVEVFNGPDANSGPSYGRFCGTNIPTEIISMTESLLIRFRTDDSVVEKGFSASYVAVEPESIDSEEMALSRASSSSSMNSRSGYSGYSGYSGQSGHSGRGNKWGKHRNSRVQHPAPYFQRHLKQVDHHSSQRTGHKYL